MEPAIRRMADIAGLSIEEDADIPRVTLRNPLVHVAGICSETAQLNWSNTGKSKTPPL